MDKKVVDKKAKKVAERGNGNITVDLGEAIDRKLRSAMGKSDEKASIGYSGGGYRPGMYGWKPYGAERPNRFGMERPNRFGMERPNRFGGSINRWSLGGSSPFGLSRQVSTMGGLTGIAVGLVGNRALMRVSPSIVKTSNLIAHSAIAFVVGLIPVLVKQNSVTLGVAIPGAVYLAGSIVDWAFDAVGIAKPALSGSAPVQSGVNQAIEARQRLIDLKGRIHPQQRVMAQQRVG
jgi:hypothetical protein